MKMQINKMLLVLGILVLAVCPGFAQTTTQGGIAGTAFDQTESVIPDAGVLIRNDGTNAEVSLKTDAAGYYKAPLLPPGTYTVTVTAAGFRQQRSTNVIVQVNMLTDLDVHLTTGEQAQTVEV